MAERGDILDVESTERDITLESSGSNDDIIEQEYVNGSKFCKPCEKREKKSLAVKFCRECSQYQCMDCSLVHTYFDSMKGHCLVAAHEAGNDNGKLDMKGHDVCKEHDKPMEFYCKDCDTVACSSCVVVKHRRCKRVLEIRSIAAYVKTPNSTIRAMTTRLKEKAQLAVDKWETADQTFHESIQQLPKKINAAREAVNSTFDQLLKSANTGSSSLMKSTNVNTKLDLDRCNQLVGIMEECIETIDNVSRFGTPEQIFIVNNQIQHFIKTSLEKSVKNLSKLKSMEIELVIKKKVTLGDLLENRVLPGYVQLKTQRLDVRPFEDELPIKLEFVDCTEVAQERNESKEPLFTGLDFLTDGRLVAVDNKNDKLKVFGTDLKRLTSYKLPAHPTAVAVIGDEVAIFFASVSCLEMYFFFVDEMNLITFVRKVSLPEQFSSICVKDNDTFVMTTINGNKPVRNVSVVGKVIDFDLNFSDKAYGIDESACAYIRNNLNEKLVLLHPEDNVVLIYDMQTGVNITVRDEVIVQPRSVAICPSNSILVATVDRIVQISPSGRILASFLADMANCRSICVSKECKLLAVTNAVKSSKMIKLFKIKDHIR